MEKPPSSRSNVFSKGLRLSALLLTLAGGGAAMSGCSDKEAGLDTETRAALAECLKQKNDLAAKLQSQRGQGGAAEAAVPAEASAGSRDGKGAEAAPAGGAGLDPEKAQVAEAEQAFKKFLEINFGTGIKTLLIRQAMAKIFHVIVTSRTDMAGNWSIGEFAEMVVNPNVALEQVRLGFSDRVGNKIETIRLLSLFEGYMMPFVEEMAKFVETSLTPEMQARVLAGIKPVISGFDLAHRQYFQLGYRQVLAEHAAWKKIWWVPTVRIVKTPKGEIEDMGAPIGEKEHRAEPANYDAHIAYQDAVMDSLGVMLRFVDTLQKQNPTLLQKIKAAVDKAKELFGI